MSGGTTESYRSLSDQNVVVAIIAAMMMGVLTAEVLTPWELTVPVLYAVPLLFSLWFLGTRLLYFVWGTAIAMTFLGIFLVPGPADLYALANRATTIALISAIGYLGVRRKKLEMRLQGVTGELEGSNAILRSLKREADRERARSEFYVDLLTHDIDNYNAAAMGYLQISRSEREGSERTAKALGALEDSTELIGMIKQVRWAKDRAKEGKEVDLNDLLLDLIKEMAPPPDRCVSVRYDPAPGRMVDAPGLLRDAVQNILWNAIVHTEGAVCIWVDLTRRMEEGSGHHLISISDNGPGIPDEMKGEVFRRRSRGRTGKGSGLGLYLVKAILEELGGRAWVEDRVPGDHRKGAKFQLLVPAAPEDRRG